MLSLVTCTSEKLRGVKTFLLEDLMKISWSPRSPHDKPISFTRNPPINELHDLMMKLHGICDFSSSWSCFFVSFSTSFLNNSSLKLQASHYSILHEIGGHKYPEGYFVGGTHVSAADLWMT